MQANGDDIIQEPDKDGSVRMPAAGASKKAVLAAYIEKTKVARTGGPNENPRWLRTNTVRTEDAVAQYRYHPTRRRGSPVLVPSGEKPRKASTG